MEGMLLIEKVLAPWRDGPDLNDDRCNGPTPAANCGDGVNPEPTEWISEEEIQRIDKLGMSLCE
jgi:hypothetical protein